MEWHKAKNIMLALLILVNLVLLGSRAYLASTERREQLAAIEGAAARLHEIGIEVDASLIPAHSPGRRLCIIPRDREAEAAFAGQILSDVTISSQGSTDRYQSDSGLALWRHGGQFEVRTANIPSDARLYEMLEDCRRTDTVLMQEISGLPVFNCTLQITPGESIRGRWCFGEPALLEDRREMSAAGLLIVYGTKVSDAPPAHITSLEYGYIAESVPNVGVRLVPVLRLCTDSEYVYLNALNGEILSVE